MSSARWAYLLWISLLVLRSDASFKLFNYLFIKIELKSFNDTCFVYYLLIQFKDMTSNIFTVCLKKRPLNLLLSISRPIFIKSPAIFNASLIKSNSHNAQSIFIFFLIKKKYLSNVQKVILNIPFILTLPAE